MGTMTHSEWNSWLSLWVDWLSWLTMTSHPWRSETVQIHLDVFKETVLHF